MSPIYPYHRTSFQLLRRALPSRSRSLSTTPIPPASAYPNALPSSQRTKPDSRPGPTNRSRKDQSFADLAGTVRKGFNVGLSQRKNAASGLTAAEALERAAHLKRLEMSQARNWKPGDVYAPHDLSPAEMTKIKKSKPLRRDPFKALNASPLDFYKNYAVMAEFCGPGMRILSRFETGLGNVNQRKYAKAVRRAVGMGLMPSVHKHPETIEHERRIAEEKLWGKDGRSGPLHRGGY